MALADTALVVSDLLQRPNNALNAAHPAAGLPRLQSAVFGSAVMGYGDLFVAGVLGGSARERDGSALAAARRGAHGGLALGLDLLFFFVDELPATVPVALTLLVLMALRRRPALTTAPHRELEASRAGGTIRFGSRMAPPGRSEPDPARTPPRRAPAGR